MAIKIFIKRYLKVISIFLVIIFPFFYTTCAPVYGPAAAKFIPKDKITKNSSINYIQNEPIP